MSHVDEFFRDAVDAPEVQDFKDVFDEADVEFENVESSIGDLLIFNHHPIVFIGLHQQLKELLWVRISLSQHSLSCSCQVLLNLLQKQSIGICVCGRYLIADSIDIIEDVDVMMEENIEMDSSVFEYPLDKL